MAFRGSPVVLNMPCQHFTGIPSDVNRKVAGVSPEHRIGAPLIEKGMATDSRNSASGTLVVRYTGAGPLGSVL